MCHSLCQKIELKSQCTDKLTDTNLHSSTCHENVSNWTLKSIHSLRLAPMVLEYLPIFTYIYRIFMAQFCRFLSTSTMGCLHLGYIWLNYNDLTVLPHWTHV